MSNFAKSFIGLVVAIAVLLGVIQLFFAEKTNLWYGYISVIILVLAIPYSLFVLNRDRKAGMQDMQSKPLLKNIFAVVLTMAILFALMLLLVK